MPMQWSKVFLCCSSSVCVIILLYLVILDINPSTTFVTEMGTVFIESEIKTNLCIIGLWRQQDVDSAVNLLITSIEYLNDII